MLAGWNEIRSDYEKAKSALWCPEGATGWRRDEATGWYYMWKAFHEASAQEEKDQLSKKGKNNDSGDICEQVQSS